MNGEVMFQPQQAAFLGSFSNIFMTFESRRKGGYGIFLLRKVTDARHEPRLFLYGGLEGPLREAVKVKPGLHWSL